MTEIYMGLSGMDNFVYLTKGFDIKISQLNAIVSADMVYKTLKSATQDEIEKYFYKVWNIWYKLLKKKSWVKANIIEKILYQINEYVVDEYDRYLNESYIDKDRFK